MKDLLHAGKLFSCDLNRDQNKDGQEGEHSPLKLWPARQDLNREVASRKSCAEGINHVRPLRLRQSHASRKMSLMFC